MKYNGFEAMTNKTTIITHGMNRTEYMDWVDFMEGDIDEDELRYRQEEFAD